MKTTRWEMSVSVCVLKDQSCWVQLLKPQHDHALEHILRESWRHSPFSCGGGWEASRGSCSRCCTGDFYQLVEVPAERGMGLTRISWTTYALCPPGEAHHRQVNRGGWRCHVSWRYHKSELKVAAGHKKMDTRARISQNGSSLQIVNPYHWLGPKVMTSFQSVTCGNFLFYFVLHCYFIISLWPKLIDDWLLIQYILQDLRCFISIIIVSIQKYWYDPW